MQQARGYAQRMKNRLADPTVGHDELCMLWGKYLSDWNGYAPRRCKSLLPCFPPS